MQAIRSFQDLTKDAAPSFWSCAASAIDIDPGLREAGQHLLAIRRRRAVSISPISPWSANALSVASGMVLTVKGAARAFT